MGIMTMLSAVAAVATVMAACSPAASTPAATFREPAASELPTLPAPRPSVKTLPTPTIEVPPPIY